MNNGLGGHGCELAGVGQQEVGNPGKGRAGVTGTPSEMQGGKAPALVSLARPARQHPALGSFAAQGKGPRGREPREACGQQTARNGVPRSGSSRGTGSCQQALERAGCQLALSRASRRDHSSADTSVAAQPWEGGGGPTDLADVSEPEAGDRKHRLLPATPSGWFAAQEN